MLSLPVVSMVIAIAYDIKVFLLILFVAMVGFAQGFWLLSVRGEGLPFGTLSEAMLSSFRYMLGDFDLQFAGSVSPTLSLCLVVVFVIFMIVLMFNLLIALMGNTFAYVSGKGLAQWRMEQASIILDEQFMRDAALVVPPCLFVLMYATDFEEYVDQRDRLDRIDRAGGESSGDGAGGGVIGATVASTKTAAVPDIMHEGHPSSLGHAAPSRSAPASVADAQGMAEGLESLERKVMERVERLESKLDSLLDKLDQRVAGRSK